MSDKVCIVLAQINFNLGDIARNTEQIISLSRQAKAQHHAQLVVFPELSLTGYPPEDLLLRPGLYHKIEQALERLKAEVNGLAIIIGLPEKTEHGLFNSAFLIENGEIKARYQKQCLPNYGVFDEKRYFSKGNAACITDLFGIKAGLVVCEDLWQPGPMAQAKEAGAELIIHINASPFDIYKPKQRIDHLQNRIKDNPLPVLSVHWVAGQDDLVFDGGTIAYNADASIAVQAEYFKAALVPVEVSRTNNNIMVKPQPLPQPLSEVATIYQALKLGVRDFVCKNGFEDVVIGLSGGIDSALTVAIAADALGPEHVTAVMMPSRHTSQMSLDDAKALAENLGVHYKIIDIEPLFQAYLTSLAEEFAQHEIDNTEQNLQARCRGTLLMALSNKHKQMVLSTSNKSETAVGYSTLYGDMVGAYCVLKDVLKTQVYELSNYRNTLNPVIPQRCIDRPPSAELAPDQVDEDNLPPYALLDDILKRYIEADERFEDLVAAGFDSAVVTHVAAMVEHSEFKRRQAPIGPRVSPRAFGRERRYPITVDYTK